MKWNPPMILLNLLLASYLLPHILILTEDRFHVAFIPYFAILAAYFWSGGMKRIFARWNESVYGKLAVTCAVVSVALLLTNWGLELLRDADTIALLLGPNGNNIYLAY